MKKRFAAVFAATAVLGVTTAFAANPFSDVTPNDWAYQAVSQLAAEGVINGYPDGTFKGERNITRYEMAQMVAKAIARQGRVDAEQNAMINRLANEFSSELNNLGVRVGNLENKVGNFKFTGDARLRYQGTDKKVDGKKSAFDYRGRVQFDATINDTTRATIRLTSDDHEFGESSAQGVQADRVYVQHDFGKYISGTVGRHDLTLASGLTYDDGFEGATLKVGNEKLNASASFGYLVDGDFGSETKATNAQMTALQLAGKIGNNVDVKGYYVATHKDGKVVTTKDSFNRERRSDATLKNFYGGSLDATFGPNDKIWVGGEFAKAESTKHSDAWVAGIGYGAYDIEKAGTWDVKGQYFSLDKNAPVYSSTWNQPANADWKGWLATVDYAMAKNIGLSAYATIDSQDKDGNSLPEYYRAELNYKF